MLIYAAAAEYRQKHPIARAILAAAEQRGLNLPTIDDAAYQVNAIKLRNIVGWVGAIPCGCPRNEVAGRPTHHCYKFTPDLRQRVGGCSEALPTLQKKRI
ncbi:hypothetical protein PN36_22010, partial [Candidatus Thiomargarita nelsonii]